MSVKRLLFMAGRLFILFVGYNLIVLFVLMAFDIFGAQWLKVLASWMFIVLFVLVVWDMVSKYGQKDSQAIDTIAAKQREGMHITQEEFISAYKPYRGYIAALIASVPAFIINMVNIIAVLSGNERLYSSLYGFITFGNFIYYEPFRSLPLADPFPALGIIPRTSLALGFEQGTALVQPWLYLVPLAIFIITSGISYQMGHRSRLKTKEAAKNAIKNRGQ